MEQMNTMNSRVDEIHDFIKMNIPILTDNKKGKQVLFFDQLPVGILGSTSSPSCRPKQLLQGKVLNQNIQQCLSTKNR